MLGRRRFVRNVFGALAAAPFAGNGGTASTSAAGVYDPALKATVPRGTRLRAVARSGYPVLTGKNHRWHAAPDGGACFAAADGGWIYVSNSEVARRKGGAGALRFAADGTLVDSYSILEGTSINCAGGKTPWGTWLSCEENGDTGLVYECDPFGRHEAALRPGLGAFQHEAAAVDPVTGAVYLTEDRPDGCLYRFRPAAVGDLRTGTLELAVPDSARLAWRPVPDPTGKEVPLRRQITDAARFQGGEGIVYSRGKVFFTTKGDNRVWSLDIATNELAVVYDAARATDPILKGVDNIEVSPNGDLLIAEDGGDMQIVALGSDYRPFALVTLHGQEGSEVTGPAFSPDGKRLYFSSQRGPEGESAYGITYELLL